MRGKELDCSTRDTTGGITPAYAGKRNGFGLNGIAFLDHPRVCGEKTKKIP